MRFSADHLNDEIGSRRQGADPETRAELDNLLFEERVNEARRQAFEAAISDVSSWDDLRDHHIRYCKAFIYVDEGLFPHTFVPGFAVRDLSGGDEERLLVRVERLARPLTASDMTFAELSDALDKGKHATVDRFLRIWNELPARDWRPVFATPKLSVADDLAQPDWPDRLRDRLGLAHFGLEPVALMEYRVKEVVAEAKRRNAPCAITAPTVLDCEPCPWYFPAPNELDCGRTMALIPVDSDGDLVVELLHVRITYGRAHLTRVGEIRAPMRPIALATLRNHHLTALRLASRCYDFGEEMPDGGGRGD